MKFIFTIDTEADNQWKRTERVSVENIKYIPRFQELCDRFDVKPTYLCTHEIVEDSCFNDTLNLYQKEGRAEIGAHLHPWTNPPYENEYDACDSLEWASYPSELPIKLFKNKMEVLTDLIFSKTGVKPTSYRSGRWGFDASHIKILLELGYKVDSSVTPYTSWRHHIGYHKYGPDYFKALNDPYYLDEQDVCRQGSSNLLEVPTTIILTNQMFDIKGVDSIFSQIRNTSIGKSISYRLGLIPKWFRPYPDMSVKELMSIYDIAVRRKMPFIQMMFHSSELMPGGSPYYPTSESVELLFVRLEELFSYMKNNSVQPVTLSEYAREFRK